jgi:hypothetical protein
VVSQSAEQTTSDKGCQIGRVMGWFEVSFDVCMNVAGCKLFEFGYLIGCIEWGRFCLVSRWQTRRNLFMPRVWFNVELCLYGGDGHDLSERNDLQCLDFYRVGWVRVSPFRFLLFRLGLSARLAVGYR